MHRPAWLPSVLASFLVCAATPSLAGNPAWTGLSPGDQTILRPVEKQWDELPGHTRARLLRLARRYQDLNPEQQTRVRERLADWARLTPEQREQARRNFETLQRLTPDQQERVRRRWLEQAPVIDEPVAP
ncbi:MAG: DUF3106 domain-containing protein [Rhodocyclaceae bacterium]|nr:DUF3106 domain-containing protein [Rhodocyclaceae bacterium]